MLAFFANKYSATPVNYLYYNIYVPGVKYLLYTRSSFLQL